MMANTQINITANGTKTLKTAGKYCDRDIDVNVNIPSSAPAPTQFTNILKQSATKFIINQMLSSTAGSYSARKGVVIVEFDFANYVAADRPKFRFRGYTPYGNYVHWSGDGGTTWTRVGWYGNYSNRSIIDEYGDASIQMSLNSNVANVKFRIDLVCGGPGTPGEDLTSESQVINSGAIMTINEPIGNGGYVG